MSPTPRRFRSPSWLDARLAVGVALVVGAVVLGAVVIGRAHATQVVLVASRDLEPGTVLSAADLASRHVRLDEDVARKYATGRRGVLGQRLDRPLGRGELIPIAATRTVSAGTTVALPLADGAAPSLAAGQRIEVWLSSPRCPAVVVLPDATIQHVHPLESGFASTSGQVVVLVLEAALAQRVMTALAIDDAMLRVGVLHGTQPPVPVPDLTHCVTRDGAGS